MLGGPPAQGVHSRVNELSSLYFLGSLPAQPSRLLFKDSCFTDSIVSVLQNNKEMDFCKSFLELDCFDTVNFST